MQKTISNLCLLQAIDDEAKDFLRERDELRQKLERLLELLELMGQGLEGKKAKLAEAGRWYKDKEGELKLDQEKVHKAKAKLQAVTKNREYMAMQREIESLRKSNATREEEILKLLEAMDEFKISIAGEQKKIESLRKEQQTEEDASAERVAVLDKKIKKISSRKDGILKELSQSVILKYNRIFKARQGIVIVPVRNSACSGCNYRVTPHQLQAVIRTETLEFCKNCNRFMFYVAVEEDADVEGEADSGGAAAPA